MSRLFQHTTISICKSYSALLTVMVVSVTVHISENMESIENDVADLGEQTMW